MSRPPEFDVPLEPIGVEPLSREEMDERERAELTATIENTKRNLRAAHVLVIVLVASIAASYLFSIFGSPFLKQEVKVPNEILSVLQAALFTLLGYLFGEKTASGKN